MDPQKEALILLDRSLERLQENIERIKGGQSSLLSQNKEYREKIHILEERKDVALKELYTMRDMIAKELHWNFDKNSKKTPTVRTPLIFMSDNGGETSS